MAAKGWPFLATFSPPKIKGTLFLKDKASMAWVEDA
jgi:hypothetical protein